MEFIKFLLDNIDPYPFIPILLFTVFMLPPCTSFELTGFLICWSIFIAVVTLILEIIPV